MGILYYYNLKTCGEQLSWIIPVFIVKRGQWTQKKIIKINK